MHILHIYAGKTHTDNKSKKKKLKEVFYDIYNFLPFYWGNLLMELGESIACLFGWLVG